MHLVSSVNVLKDGELNPGSYVPVVFIYNAFFEDYVFRLKVPILNLLLLLSINPMPLNKYDWVWLSSLFLKTEKSTILAIAFLYQR